MAHPEGRWHADRVAEPDCCPAAAPVAAVTQGRRTADWLRKLPLARLRADGGRLADEARQLIAAFDAATRDLCDAGGDRCEAPPEGARIPVLADHALGDQLAVMADQLGRAVGADASAGPGAAAAQALATSCIALRSRGSGLPLG